MAWSYVVSDFNFFLERAQRNNLGFASRRLAFSSDWFDLSIHRRKRKKQKKKKLTEHLVSSVKHKFGWLFYMELTGSLPEEIRMACFGITCHRLRAGKWFLNWGRWSLFGLSKTTTIPKITTAGCEEEIIRLVRLLSVTKHYYSWIRRLELVLRSALWQSVPDLGLRGCYIAVWTQGTWLLFSISTSEKASHMNLVALVFFDSSPQCALLELR